MTNPATSGPSAADNHAELLELTARVQTLQKTKNEVSDDRIQLIARMIGSGQVISGHGLARLCGISSSTAYPLYREAKRLLAAEDAKKAEVAESDAPAEHSASPDRPSGAERSAPG